MAKQILRLLTKSLKKSCNVNKSLQKVAWVTGASSGFGALIAKELAKEGYYVYASARRKEKLTILENNNIQAAVLDVTSSKQCQQVFDHIMAERGRIDVLINNAGYGYMAPVEEATLKGMKDQFDVNVFACTRLMQLVTPVMRKQSQGLIINMSSVVGHLSMPLLGFYAGSKHALEAISDAARNELNPFGIDVVLIEPGAIRTEFEDVAFDSLSKSVKHPFYKSLAKRLQGHSKQKYKRAPGPEAVANVVTKITRSKKPKRRYVVGLDAKFLIPLKNIIGDGLIDPVLRFMLKLTRNV